MYTKVGMFGSSPDSLQPGTIILQQGPAQDAIRGFGFQHDGSLGQLEHFFTAQVFLKSLDPVILADGTVVPPNPFGIPFINPNQPFSAPGVPNFIDDGGFALRHAIVAFMMAFDSNFAPIVGQQLTVTPATYTANAARLDLLEQRATAGECELVAKTNVFGATAGMLFNAGSWRAASTFLPPISDAQMRLSIRGFLSPPVTFTCVPPGEGQRVALDRDNDGYADWDELLYGRDPADPSSHP
jgi:hypothetical protein